MVAVRMNLRDLAGSSTLTGAISGRSLLCTLLKATPPEPASPEPIFLDFSNVEIATASFLRESLLAFRDVIRGRRSNFYPVLANPNDTVRDELIELMYSRKDIFMSCTLNDSGSVTDAMPIGDLDPKQRMTFNLVCERGETDAADLMRNYGESQGITTQTAWNHRLTSLATLGLVVEISQGRTKRYKPLFQGA